MATVYGFVRQSGGTVTIDSLPGEGTAVHIYLPYVEGPAAARPSLFADAAQTAVVAAERAGLITEPPRFWSSRMTPGFVDC